MILVAGAYVQDATYWEPIGVDSHGGLIWSAPQALKVRWEDRVEEFTDTGGRTLVSNSVVFVPQPLHVGGYLCKGVSLMSSPDLEPEAHEIKQYRQIPDIRNATYERRAFL